MGAGDGARDLGSKSPRAQDVIIFSFEKGGRQASALLKLMAALLSGHFEAGKSFKAETSSKTKSFKAERSSTSGKSFKAEPSSSHGKSFKAGKSFKGEAWVDFEEYGSFAGPPGQPAVSEVGATSLLIPWDPPQHLGGKGFEVLGYQVRIQFSGDGGFNVHTDDTGSSQTQHAIEQLATDTWHEFQVSAITTAGVGTPSRTSRPVLTDRAPALLRELNAATKQLGALRERMRRKRDELLHLARSGTMALRQGAASASADADASGSSDAIAPDGQAARPTAAASGWYDYEDVDGDGTEVMRSNATMTAAETKVSVRARKQLERQVESLARRVSEQETVVAALHETQAGVDAERREELDDAAANLRETGEDDDGGVGGAGAAGGAVGFPRIYRDEPLEHSAEHSAVGVSDTPYSTNTGRSCGSSDRKKSRMMPWSAPTAAPSAAPAGAPAGSEGAFARGRRRSLSTEMKRMATLAAYAKLFLEEDTKVERTYEPFNRDLVRVQMHRALSSHVLASDVGGEMAHYFDLVLNRVRSALTHNVFPLFSDDDFEHALLLFGRFDTDHDGVLEFGDFCNLMLLVGGRVNATYYEAQLVRMFKKVDVNADNLSESGVRPSGPTQRLKFN